MKKEELNAKSVQRKANLLRRLQAGANIQADPIDDVVAA